MVQIHCLGLPHTVSNADYVACAFTQKVRKFLTMFQGRGYKTIHYGHRDSVTDADEQVAVTDNETLEKAYGGYDWKKGLFKHAVDDYAHQTFNANAGREIYARKQQRQRFNSRRTWDWVRLRICTIQVLRKLSAQGGVRGSSDRLVLQSGMVWARRSKLF